ncbi:hypothetical protein ONZ45_g19662 [Pleurotus djamor]|nr:hypothetical protein ONZ45_g19662 [Pleurotus djamor]
MGEHSPVDALVPSIVGEYSVVDDINHHAFDEPISEPVAVETWWSKPSTTYAASTTRLDWYVDQHMLEECDKARNRAVDIVNDSDDSVLWFRHYGTDWVKQIANLAPDAYIQQALQLAWYRTRGTFTATYETALTRMFKHGRTETIRTHTKDSREWVLSMDDSRQSVAQRTTLLRRAIRAHSVLTREAATGSGVDRHLMGLQLLCPPQSGPPPRLLADEVFQRSASWKLSTSGLSAGYLFRGTGFGAQYTDGYGINYLAAPDMIKFGIESKAHNPLTSTPVFQEAVINALQDMKRSI